MEQSTNASAPAPAPEPEPADKSISLVDSRRLLFEKIVTGDRDAPSVRKSRVFRSNGVQKVMNNVSGDGDDHSGDVCASSVDRSGHRHRGSANADESLAADDEDDADVTSCVKINHHDEDGRVAILHSETQPSDEVECRIDCAATVNPDLAIIAAPTAAVCENSNRIQNDEMVAPCSSDHDLNYSKRTSYHQAVFAGARTKLGTNVTRVRENVPIIKSNVAPAPADVDESSRRDRETECVNMCNLDTIDNVVNDLYADDTSSENLTCSEDLTNSNVNKSEPSNIISSRSNREDIVASAVVSESSSCAYPVELNPFGEDDDEETDEKIESHDSTNPFGSDSESENEDSCSKSEKANTNPFCSGSDEEDEDKFATNKLSEELKTSPANKTPVPLPRRIKAVVPVSPQPSPRSHVKNNNSNEISPATSCHSLLSLSSRKLSSESLEVNFIRSPSSVNSTLRKKKPAPRPPPLRPEKVFNDENLNQKSTEEQIQKSDIAVSKNSSGQDTRKTVISPWKNKKGPAPARPIPLRRPVKEMPLEDIKTELTDIEIRQQELERQSLQMEEKIRETTEAESPESPAVEEMVVQLFELVNEKNELFRRRSELINMRKMHSLEEEHAEIEYQIRCLMLRPESNKTDTDKTREEELIKRLLEVVEKKNEIIETMEKDRQRETAEDESVTTQLGNRTNSDKKEIKSKEKKMKKNKKEKSKEYNEGDGKGYDNDKHSPSKLIKQKFMTLRYTAKKLHPKLPN